MPEDLISIIDLTKQLGKRKQTIHKIVKRLTITPTLMRSSDNGGQRISYITSEEARLVSQEMSNERAKGANAEWSGSSSEAPLTDSEHGFFYLMKCEPELAPGRF